MTDLILLRHGQSVWNQQHRFTGWADVELTERGVEQAVQAGLTLKRHQLTFDRIYCSQLNRARQTLRHVLESSIQDAAPKIEWRLNERHNGLLEGLGPLTAIRRFGLRPVLACQLLSYCPPPLPESDARYPGNQAAYAQLDRALLPRSESLDQVSQRLRPLWEEAIKPDLQQGRSVLVVAHKNLLRELMKMIGPERTPRRLATGQPWLYHFDREMVIESAGYLGR